MKRAVWLSQQNVPNPDYGLLIEDGEYVSSVRNIASIYLEELCWVVTQSLNMPHMHIGKSFTLSAYENLMEETDMDIYLVPWVRKD